MWNGNPNMLVPGESMNSYESDGSFAVEASRKRKILDYEPQCNPYDIVSRGSRAGLGADIRCSPSKESYSQKFVVPQEINSNSCWRNSEVFVPQSLHLVKSLNAESQIGSSHGCNFSNLSNSVQMKCAKLHEGANSSFSSIMLPKKESCRTLPVETAELSEKSLMCYGTNPPEAAEAHPHTNVNGGLMMEWQDPTQLHSMLKMECTSYAVASKRHPSLIAFEGQKNDLEFCNHGAVDITKLHMEGREQDQAIMSQKPMPFEPSNCEQVNLNNVNMDHSSASSVDEKQQKESNTIHNYDPHSVQAIARTAEISSWSSHSSDEEIKTDFGNLSPPVCESLWDGSLQLSTSTRVSTLAFFKSGEKTQYITWPKLVEIKGKVKLQAFEKFVQELPRSRNRSLMVISLCWKVGSSKAGLKGMKEVAKGYKESKRVGFAQICPGFDLYVCPRSEAIITILAKYGFFKGISAVKEDQDSLIGCVVWRRNPRSTNSDTKKSEVGKASSGLSTVETNCPIPEVHGPEGQQATPYFRSSTVASSKNVGGIQCAPETTQDVATKNLRSPQVPTRDTGQMAIATEKINSISRFKSVPLVVPQPLQTIPGIQQNIQFFMEPNYLSTPTISPSQIPPLPTSCPTESSLVQSQAAQIPYTSSASGTLGTINPVAHSIRMEKCVPVVEAKEAVLPGPLLLPPHILDRIIHSQKAAEKDFKVENSLGSIRRQKIASSAAECTEIHHTCPSFLARPNILDDEDDLPEFDFRTACGAQVAPVNKYPLHSVPSFKKQLPVEPAKTVSGFMPREVLDTNLSGQMQRPSVSFFRAEAIKSREETLQRVNITTVGLEDKLVASAALSSEAGEEQVNSMSFCSLQRRNSGDAGDDDDDMPEWCPPEQDHRGLPGGISMEVTCSTFKTIPAVEAQRPIYPSVPLRSFSPPRGEGFLPQHHPHVPPRSCSPAKRQAAFPQDPHPSGPFSPSKGHVPFSQRQRGILGPCPSSTKFSTLEQVRPAGGFAPSGSRCPTLHTGNRYPGSEDRSSNGPRRSGPYRNNSLHRR